MVLDGRAPPVTHLYGAFEQDGVARVGVRYGDRVLDLAAALEPDLAAEVMAPNLDRLLAARPSLWRQVFDAVASLEPPDEHLHDLADVRLQMPFTVADYVDFYSSEHHARNLGRMLRPGQPELPPNWRHLPVGYHGRAGTVVVSGTDVVRPDGQRRTAEGEVVFGPTTRLDIEAEVGYVVGVPSRLGTAVPLDAFADHVFGICLVNDWSARDIQGWEYQPLGPFLGKSFATSVAAWVTPLAALERSLGRTAASRPATAALPRRRRDGAGRPGPPPGGPAQRQPGVGAAVRPDVLDRCPAARAPDRQRGIAAHRRPVRVRHGQRPGAW